MSSYTHFTLDERKYIQELLFLGNSIRMIVRSLGRSPSSVSREIISNKRISSLESSYRYYSQKKEKKETSYSSRLYTMELDYQ